MIRKLHRDGQHEEYDNILQEQLHQEIVEPVPDDVHGKEFNLLHKGVNRVNKESTKLRIVYDASATERSNQPSLTNCTYRGS